MKEYVSEYGAYLVFLTEEAVNVATLAEVVTRQRRTDEPATP